MSHVATSFLVLVSFTSVTQADAIGLFTEQKDIGVAEGKPVILHFVMDRAKLLTPPNVPRSVME